MEAEKIIIRRATPKTQEIDLHNGARLTAELIERLGDKLIMIVQEICQEIKSDIIDRELTFLKEIHANTIRARGISTWDFFVQNSATIMGNLSLQYGNIYAPYYAYIRSLEVSDSIEVNRNINTKNGEIREKGVRVYSPNNPPTLADVIVTDGKTIEGGGTQDEPLKIVDGAFVTPDELHEEKETRIKGDIDTLNDAKNYTDQTTANLNLKINSIENLGHYAGAFDAYALLPANTSEYPSGITVNDFATIRADETHGGDVTRYVVREIDAETGDITWVYDVTYTTDISGKADKVTGAADGNFAGLDAGGNLTDSGKKAADFISVSDKGAAGGVATLGNNGLVPLSQLPEGLGKKYATVVIGNTGAGHTADMVDYLCTGTDDHLTINAAIQELPEGGGKIVLLEGNYLCSGTIILNKQRVMISGMGISTTISIETAVMQDVINITGDYCEIRDVFIRTGGSVFRDKSTVISINAFFIMNNVRMELNSVGVNEGKFIVVYQQKTLEMRNCYLYTTGGYTTTAIILYDARRCIIQNNFIMTDGNDMHMGTGISVKGGIENVISNNIIYGSAYPSYYAKYSVSFSSYDGTPSSSPNPFCNSVMGNRLLGSILNSFGNDQVRTEGNIIW